jgi:hypothetical protein
MVQSTAVSFKSRLLWRKWARDGFSSRKLRQSTELTVRSEEGMRPVENANVFRRDCGSVAGCVAFGWLDSLERGLRQAHFPAHS